jgi:thiamine pyrophosphate-dependent acetolactate synthase large subunit-like protein
MALSELETLGRLGLPLLVVIYDDAAYGAEVHHFRPMGQAVDLAQFPATDFAALAEAAGCRGITARRAADLDGVREWLETPDRPLVLDAKVDPDVRAEWLEEAFR